MSQSTLLTFLLHCRALKNAQQKLRAQAQQQEVKTAPKLYVKIFNKILSFSFHRLVQPASLRAFSKKQNQYTNKRHKYKSYNKHRLSVSQTISEHTYIYRLA